MSSTRRVEPGARRRQEGWASAPEYDVLRGLNGTAVAFKAALQDSQAKRELLFFLQALSLRDGGVKRIARELLEMFPERLGTPTMHAISCKPDKRLTAEQCDAIEEELHRDRFAHRLLLAMAEPDEPAKPIERQLYKMGDYLEDCRERARSLNDFIEELCCNPRMELSASSASSYRESVELVLDDARRALERNPHIAKEQPALAAAVGDRRNSSAFYSADVSYFHDVLGALFEFKRRYSESAGAGYVETSIGKTVFEALDYVLETGRSALIEGSSGFGKTTALKAWCEMHLGQARYIQLSGITSRSVFFRKLAKALGVANGGGMSSVKIQARVEDLLQRTKLMLVIDEAQYMWPQTKRVETHPELINWLNTSCYNESVPFALAATKQFTLRRQIVERQTDWSSEQLRRRTRKVFPLPDAPTSADLQAVARNLLGDLGEGAVDFIVGYALTSRGYFQAVCDSVEDAQLIARRAGRDRITFKDLKTAVYEERAPSDAALQRVFDSKPETRRRRQTEPCEPPNFAPLSELLNGRSSGFDPACSRLQSGGRSLRPVAEPVPAG